MDHYHYSDMGYDAVCLSMDSDELVLRTKAGMHDFDDVEKAVYDNDKCICAHTNQTHPVEQCEDCESLVSQGIYFYRKPICEPITDPQFKFDSEPAHKFKSNPMVKWDKK